MNKFLDTLGDMKRFTKRHSLFLATLVSGIVATVVIFSKIPILAAIVLFLVSLTLKLGLFVLVNLVLFSVVYLSLLPSGKTTEKQNRENAEVRDDC